MSTWYLRINGILSYAGTCLALLCIAVTITDYFHRSNPIVTADIIKFEGLEREFGHDKAYPVIDLYMDLTSEFTWNTKQIFAFTQLEWATKKNKRNRAILWTTIIESKQDAQGTIKQLKPNYPFAVNDQGQGLRGTDFNITVSWNVIPKVGRIYTKSMTFSGFTFPEEYVEAGAGVKENRFRARIQHLQPDNDGGDMMGEGLRSEEEEEEEEEYLDDYAEEEEEEDGGDEDDDDGDDEEGFEISLDELEIEDITIE